MVDFLSIESLHVFRSSMHQQLNLRNYFHLGKIKSTFLLKKTLIFENRCFKKLTPYFGEALIFEIVKVIIS